MTLTSLVVTPPPSTKMTYEWLIPATAYCTNPLTVIPGLFCLSLVLCLVRVTNEDKALAYNCPQEPTPIYF